jgi:hypothetical protein
MLIESSHSSSPRRISQPTLFEHKLKDPTTFRGVDIAQLTDVLLLELAILLHGLAEDAVFDELVRLGLDAELDA